MWKPKSAEELLVRVSAGNLEESASFDGVAVQGVVAPY
jgi:hypothetical protein